MQVEKAQAAILHNLTRRGMKLKDFGLAIGQSQKTGYNKYHDPKKLTVEDINLMHMDCFEALELLDIKK